MFTQTRISLLLYFSYTKLLMFSNVEYRDLLNVRDLEINRW